MKDYFDRWVLPGDNTLDQAELRRVVEAKFNRRKMTRLRGEIQKVGVI